MAIKLGADQLLEPLLQAQKKIGTRVLRCHERWLGLRQTSKMEELKKFDTVCFHGKTMRKSCKNMAKTRQIPCKWRFVAGEIVEL